MRYLPIIIGVIVFIYGLIDCIRSEPSDVRSLPKPAWIVVILLLPFIGVLLWLFFGRPQYSEVSAAPAAQSKNVAPRRSLAPDDDPEFLRNIEIARSQKAEAERLRKLKEELDAREARLREDQPNDESSTG